MPNWCYTSFTITGSKEDLERFTHAVTVPSEDLPDNLEEWGDVRPDIDLTLPYPTPEDLKIRDVFGGTDWDEERIALEKKYEENLAKYGARSWYDWNCAHWGTKWSPRVTEYDLIVDFDHAPSIQGHYETAWAPCSLLLAELSRQFPTIKFFTTFTEESDAYVGCEIFYQGRVFSHSFDPFDSKNLPEWIATRIQETHAKMEKSDFGSEDWGDALEEMTDLRCELQDLAQERAYSDLREAFPSVATV